MKLISLNKIRAINHRSRLDNQGLFAMVDDSDFEWLNQWNWYAFRKSNTCYVHRNEYDGIARKVIKMHRFILGITDPNILGDHIDGNGLNCQRNNLRIATFKQNSYNTKSHKNSSSQYKGVSYHKQGRRWQASIRINGKLIYLGKFTSEEKAAIAYNNMAETHQGKFANLNKI